MWRSFSVLILAASLAACGYEIERIDADAPAVVEVASLAPAPVPAPAPAAAPAPTTPVAAEPIPVESGVIHEYCVFITYVTHFPRGTTQEQVRTLSDTIMQRLCVDGHPASGTVVPGSDTLNGREIEWSAQFK